MIKQIATLDADIVSTIKSAFEALKKKSSSNLKANVTIPDDGVPLLSLQYTSDDIDKKQEETGDKKMIERPDENNPKKDEPERISKKQKISTDE